jgi:Isochorismatase family
MVAFGAKQTCTVVATHVSFLRENVMSDPTRPYEPLTSENAALVLVDHQVGLMAGVRDYSTGELKHNVVPLAKAAKALKLPIILTTTARDRMWGPTFPELVEARTCPGRSSWARLRAPTASKRCGVGWRTLLGGL